MFIGYKINLKGEQIMITIEKKADKNLVIRSGKTEITARAHVYIQEGVANCVTDTGRVYVSSPFMIVEVPE